MVFYRILQKALLIYIILFSYPNSGICQNPYQDGWESLNNADVDQAIKHFQKALNNPSLRENALLSLCLLYSQSNRVEEASKLFNQYFDESENPYPALYSMWFEEGVIDKTGKKKPYQLELLKKIEKSKQNIGKLDAATQYRLGLHYSFSMDNKKARNYYNEIKNIEDWMFLGPFDNVMNSGYDKDFGVVAHPESKAIFSSKNGAEISWFDPVVISGDGYTFKNLYFVNNNSIIYAQTFVEAQDEKEVFLKFGYSGSLKVWINDSLIYREPERRETEMDYFLYKCKLNKGYNRILVQLGDHEESFASFTLRFTDLNHVPILLPQKNELQPYQKKLIQAERIPYFATEGLEKKAKENDNDLLYKVLLAYAYLRSHELNKAEEVLKSAHDKAPLNYFILRSMVVFYNQANDNTNQNKYYELFRENYPHDSNILENEIEENEEKGDKEKVKELISIYLSKYPNRYKEMYYELYISLLNEDNQKVLEQADNLYQKFPEDYYALVTKYNIEKSFYSNPEKANNILKNYLKNSFSENVLSELAANYIKEGKFDEAIKLLEKKIELFPYDIDVYRNIVNILTRQTEYEKAINVCEKIMENRPSDYSTLNDLAVLHKFNGDEQTAIMYYEEALRYFPFSFETNEKIRELKGLKKAIDLVGEFDPAGIIKDYENNFKPPIKKSYDIVSESKSVIIFKSKATGIVHRYILRINDEKAIEEWQQVNFTASPNMTLYIDDVKTIKKNGNKIDAERNNGEAVFTNLEVGDYIYVSYNEKQEYGGKSSVFISDRHALNSYYPIFKVEYNVLVEDGATIVHTILNDTLKPIIAKVAGFTNYKWTKNSPEVLKSEPYNIPFNDLAQRVHISLNYSWRDIVQWYSDLSTYQAMSDYTIKKITEELFAGKNFSDHEKSRIIYEFVSKNIQYSLIDFRQSSYIPQKASQIYNSRLGDCKDVSTLYVSIAREAGLDANLVLINTSNNGQNDVLLPSLNFNHCIVKVYLEDGSKYLELTDPDLPYGHLYYYHKGAAILEIPTVVGSDEIKLNRLDLNPNYKDEVFRNSYVTIESDYRMRIEQKVMKTGTKASSSCRNYYYVDEKEKKDNLKNAISSQFKSALKIEELNFEILNPREDTAKYSYTYTVENDVLKLGTFRTFKIPFSDYLIEMSIFEDGQRHNLFDFVYYEPTDKYDEIIEISLNDNFSFEETPKNIHLEYNGNTYELTFEKINDKKLKVHRIYKVKRANINQEDFSTFKAFMSQVNEAENTHLLFK